MKAEVSVCAAESTSDTECHIRDSEISLTRNQKDQFAIRLNSNQARPHHHTFTPSFFARFPVSMSSPTNKLTQIFSRHPKAIATMLETPPRYAGPIWCVVATMRWLPLDVQVSQKKSQKGKSSPHFLQSRPPHFPFVATCLSSHHTASSLIKLDGHADKIDRETAICIASPCMRVDVYERNQLALAYQLSSGLLPSRSCSFSVSA